MKNLRFTLSLTILGTFTLLAWPISASAQPSMQFKTNYSAPAGQYKTSSIDTLTVKSIIWDTGSNTVVENGFCNQYPLGTQALSTDGTFTLLTCLENGMGDQTWQKGSGGAFSLLSAAPEYILYPSIGGLSPNPATEFYKIGLGTTSPEADIHVITNDGDQRASLRLEEISTNNAIWELRSNQLIGALDSAFSIWGGEDDGFLELKDALAIDRNHRVIIADEIQGGFDPSTGTYTGEFDRNSNSKLSIQKNHTVIDPNFIYSGRSALSLVMNNDLLDTDVANGDGIGIRFSVNTLGYPTAAIVAQSSDVTKGAGHLHFTTRKATGTPDNRFAVGDIDMTIRDSGLVSIGNPDEDGSGFPGLNPKLVVNGNVGLAGGNKYIQGLGELSSTQISGSTYNNMAVSVKTLKNYFTVSNVGSCFAIRMGTTGNSTNADTQCIAAAPSIPAGLLPIPGSTNGYLNGTAYNPAGGAIPGTSGPIMCQYIWCNP